MAVASAGPYASLHLAPDNHASTPPFFFTGRIPFLLPNQQCQSTEGMSLIAKKGQTDYRLTDIRLMLDAMDAPV